MEKVEQIHGFLKLLLTPISGESSASERERFENSLRTNLEHTLNGLNSKELIWLKEWMKEIDSEEICNDICWQFTSYVAKTLVCLSDALSVAQRSCNEEEGEKRCRGIDGSAPPATILSIQQQTDIRLALHFLTCFGISRNLLPGVGIELWRRSQFGRMVAGVETEEKDVSEFQKHQMLYSTVNSLFSLCRNATFGSLVLSNFLSDLLAALCQLCYRPLKKIPKSEGEPSLNLKEERRSMANELLNEQITLFETHRKQCFVMLNSVLERTLERNVVRELLLLQGSPPKSGNLVIPAPNWLRKATQKLLTETMMKKNGVIAVIQGILETEESVTNVETSNWNKCNMVANLVAVNFKAEAYQPLLSAQILHLLDLRDGFSSNHFKMVASATIRNVFLSQPTIAEKYLVAKLMKPLIVCSENETFDRQFGDQFTACILKLHTVYVSGTDPNGTFLQSLSPVVSLLLHVYTFVQNSVSYLKKPVEELLCSYLKHVESSLVHGKLREILFGEIDCLKVTAWNSDLELSLDDKVELIVTERKKNTTKCYTTCLEDDTARASTILLLLSRLENDDIVCKFFLSQLENLTSFVDDKVPLEPIPSATDKQSDLLRLEQDQERDLANTRRSLLNLHILSALSEGHVLQESIMKDKMQATQFLAITLERSVALCLSQTYYSKPMESETLMMVMGILTLMLGSQESLELKPVIRNCVSLLRELKNKHPSEDVRMMAAELEMAIVTDGKLTKQSEHKDSTKKEFSKYQEAWEDLHDSEIPIRGHALLTMTKLLTAKDKETMANRDKLLVAFMEHLKHDDSYVYMMAIQGLIVLADRFPDTVIQVLVDEYGRNNSRLPTEMRMKLGEVLIKVTRTLGEMIPKYRDQLLDVFLSTTRDSDPMIRSSSLSNLGEVCKELRYALGPNVHEIFNCLSNFAKSDADVHVRRAAVQVIVLLLRGLGKAAFVTLDDILKDLYALIKHVHRVDNDETVKLHAQLALEELDIICKELLFPKQSLELKIRVLDA